MSGESTTRAVYSLMTAIVAVMDIVAMLVKDVGLAVEDGYMNKWGERQNEAKAANVLMSCSLGCKEIWISPNPP